MNKLQKPQALLATATRSFARNSTRFYHRHQLSPLIRPRPGYLPSQPPTYAIRRDQVRYVSYEQQAKDLNQKGIDNQLHDYDAKIAADQEKQRQAPWHREGSDKPPVHTQREAGAMTKGKLTNTLFISINTYATRKTTHHSRKTTEACPASEHCRH